MKKYRKNIFVLCLAVVTAVYGILSASVTQSTASQWGENSVEDSYGDTIVIPPEQRYYSIQNAYIASYTSQAITFSWYSAGNNDGFYIYRMSPYDSGYKKIGTVKNIQYSTHMYKDTGFRKGLSFSYRIVAYITDGAGKNIEVGGVYTVFKADFKAPKFSALKRKASKATLKWKKSDGAEGYEIFCKKGKHAYKKVKTIKNGSTLTWTAKKLSGTQTTKFKIRAYLKYGSHYVRTSFSQVKTAYALSTQKVVKIFKKLQKQYPNGKYWNHAGKKKYNSSTITSRPCNHNKGNGLSTCNHYNCPNGIIGYQCYGFAWKMSDLIYGRTAKIKNFRSFAKCRMGDVIRYSGHSVIVVEKHSNYVVVGECNAGNTCMIQWGRKVYRSELHRALYSSRYR